MKTFRTSTYSIPCAGLTGHRKVTFAVLADLHGLVFGQIIRHCTKQSLTQTRMLFLSQVTWSFTDRQKLSKQQPDFFLRLCEIAPVFYVLGNHEYKMYLNPDTRNLYLNYEKLLTSAGICFLHNEHMAVELQGSDFVFHGLELPIEYYHKPNSPALSLTTMEELIGMPSQPGVHVLLAHNPKYGNTYFSWGADLILSGHYHGGILRLNENHGLTCPQFLFLPPYCCGKFTRGSQHMIVSAGLGEHTIPIRIHNPRELILVDLVPD